MRLLPLPGVFKPHSDSLLLAERLVLETSPGAAVLDLCTGSGVLAITAARAGAGRVVAVDVSRRAVASVRIGARLNGVSVEARRGDLLAAVGGRRFDLIVSNPPYVPGADDRLPRSGRARAWEAGRSGRLFIDRICAGAATHLRPRGVLLLLQSSVCGEQATRQALEAHGLHGEVVVRHDGSLGPLLSRRAPMLRARGQLQGEREELLIFRAVAADPS